MWHIQWLKLQSKKGKLYWNNQIPGRTWTDIDKNKYIVLVLESCYLLLIPSALTHKAISEKGIKFNLTNPKNLSQSIPSRPPHTINPENLWTSQPPMWERMKIIRGSIVERWERLAGKFGNWFINRMSAASLKGGLEAEPLFKEQWEFYSLYYTLLLQ